MESDEIRGLEVPCRIRPKRNLFRRNLPPPLSPLATMESRSLFSRGPSPPRATSFDLIDNTPTVDPAPSASPTHIEALFNNLGSPTSTQAHSGPFMNPLATHESNSAPATPGSLHAGAGGSTASSTVSAPVTTSSDRQNALLSLLGSVSNTNATNTPNTTTAPVPQLPQQVQQQQQQPQQIPTPPGSASAGRSVPAPTNESQGKFLLDQLMSG
jgi:hypothetical protein